jgi:type II secretory pathway component GspD/PulD (secretin)
MNDITNIVGMIDIPRGQVYIEAKFMELTDTAIKNLGINWQMLQGYQVGGSAKVLDQKEMISSTSRDQGNLAKIDDHTVADSVSGTYKQESDGLVPVTTPTRTVADALNRGIAADKTLSDTSSRDFSNIRTALLNPLSFNLILSALKQESGVSVVSNPRILVANSEAATIHIGEQRTPLIPRTSSIEGSLRTTYEPGAIVDSGVKLTVTPTINTESNITVEIKPEITRILPEGQWTTAPDGSKYPATANKIITTIFSLLSGETAAIGGLTETSDEDTVSKIPLLGDIPLLGKYFFSHQSKTKTQKETIIFVTVGLVSSDRLEENVGLPSGAELVHKRTVIDNEERREFDQKMSALQDAAKQREERSARKRQFLLNRIR